MFVKQKDALRLPCDSVVWQFLFQTSHCPVMCLVKTVSNSNLKVVITCVIVTAMYQKYLGPHMIRLYGMLLIDYVQLIRFDTIHDKATVSNTCYGRLIYQHFINKDKSCYLYLSTIKAVTSSQLHRALLTGYRN